MNKNTKIGLTVGILVIIALTGALFTRSKSDYSATYTAATTSPLATDMKAYSLADVATHSTQASCWTTIDGGVYDVTTWINQHPGGPDAILSLCGKDGSAAFNGQHGGQRRPANELASFKIGTLTQ